jgi:hypothetical protein
MAIMNRRTALFVGSLAGLAACRRNVSADELPKSPVNAESIASAVSNGRTFLVELLDPSLDLLPEYRGANVYWLYHDNYLAAKVLNETLPDVAQKIRAAMKREGVERSGKIEILFGEVEKPLPFKQYQLIDVRQAGKNVIRTEIVLKQPFTGWEKYADLLLMACIAEKDRKKAGPHYDAVMKMWDGKGFFDPATRELKRYSTYKLALTLIAAHKWDRKTPTGLVETLLSLQAESGGWITDYEPDGKPIGLANVETTSLSILGLESQKP